MEKDIVINSFSGGRTSAYMTKYMVDNYSDKYQFINLFANTGQEHPKTLEFIDKCDKEFGFNTVWLESVVHHNQRKGNTHKIVTYETATRDLSLFENMIKKHGIPNMAFPHCTRELKLAPIYSYIREIGLKRNNITMAIGIRADETRRVRKDATEANIIYPLIDLGIDKKDVLDWWKNQKFDLEIQEHQGNCMWCWKKSHNKHYINLKENPTWYDIPEMLEEKYPFIGADYRKEIPTKHPRVFFRGNMSTLNLKDALLISGNNSLPLFDNESNTCSESCELLETI